MRCKNCGYRLRDLEENRCPECSHQFKPDDPSTFMPDELPPLRMRAHLSLAWIVAFLSSVAIMAISILGVWSAFPVVVVVAAILIFMIWYYWYIRPRKFRD